MSETEKNILKYCYEQGMLHKLWSRQSQNILKLLVHKSANYYLKPNDIISHRPTLFGYHEPHLEGLVSELARTHGDFLLDIGANIGMTSVMVGHHFDSIHAVEPNRTVLKILEANLKLSNLTGKTTIHPVGLGNTDRIETLLVPSSNYGGAFVETGNAYTGENNSINKNGLKLVSQEIQIRKGSQWLTEVFKANPNWKRGVIKIDVEGFELPVFEALLKTIPKNLSAVVIMENFLARIDYEKFATRHHKLSWYGLYKVRNWLKSIPFKLIGMSPHYKTEVREISASDIAPHDLIVYLQPAA